VGEVERAGLQVGHTRAQVGERVTEVEAVWASARDEVRGLVRGGAEKAS